MTRSLCIRSRGSRGSCTISQRYNPPKLPGQVGWKCRPRSQQHREELPFPASSLFGCEGLTSQRQPQDCKEVTETHRRCKLLIKTISAYFTDRCMMHMAYSWRAVGIEDSVIHRKYRNRSDHIVFKVDDRAFCPLLLIAYTTTFGRITRGSSSRAARGGDGYPASAPLTLQGCAAGPSSTPGNPHCTSCFR